MQSIKKEAIDSVNETAQTIRSAEKKNEGQEFLRIARHVQWQCQDRRLRSGQRDSRSYGRNLPSGLLNSFVRYHENVVQCTSFQSGRRWLGACDRRYRRLQELFARI